MKKEPDMSVETHLARGKEEKASSSCLTEHAGF